MDSRAQITLRSKKLGLLIRDMRLAQRRSLEECAQAIGVTPDTFRAYEEAERSPSLPELEALVYYLQVPIQRFWSDTLAAGSAQPGEKFDLHRLYDLRQRMIGARLRKEREKTNYTIQDLAQETGIAAGQIEAYELGESPIPVPVLDVLLTALSSRVEVFFDQGGPVGSWLTSQKAIEKFLDLPKELQDFVCQPVNRPYLELAIKLSEMSKERLRSVAEGLLDITL